MMVTQQCEGCGFDVCIVGFGPISIYFERLFRRAHFILFTIYVLIININIIRASKNRFMI